MGRWFAMNKKAVSWWNTEIGGDELLRIRTSVRNRWISQGPVTEEFEAELAKLLHVPYVILTTNGSTALLMALLASGIKPGDEVIVPGITFIATAQAPLLLGAKIKLVDVGSSRPVIDPDRIEKAISSKTKVIIPVHFNGLSADMKRINRLAVKHNLRVVEDASEALCSRNRYGYLGTQSHIGAFSLSLTKLLTSGQGGFLTTRDRKTFRLLRKIRNYGMSFYPDRQARYEVFGFNFKFNDILAGIGLSQLKKIGEKIEAVRKIYSYYKEGLRDLDYIKLLEVDEERGEFPLWIAALCAQRDKVVRSLKEKNIQAVPFDPCLSEAPYLKQKGDFRYSKVYAQKGLFLPCGPDQKMQAIQSTVSALNDIKTMIKCERC